MSGEVTVAPHVAALRRSAADIFVAAAAEAVQSRGVFRVALAGGSTPRGVYELLASDERLRSAVDWTAVRVFFGDERHVGPDHADSNFRMAHDAILGRVPIDPQHVWRIKGEYAAAADAAREYEQDVRAAFALKDGQLPRFDLVLLGLGRDGHTASLFPHTDALYERNSLVVSNRVAALMTERITLTLPVLNNAAEVLFLVHGEDKAAAVSAVLEGPFDPDRLPAQFIQPVRQRLRWLLDPAAASLLSCGAAMEGR